MAEVKMGGLWKVVITEYEAGWGQRVDPDDTKFFDNEAEARAYAARMSSGDYEIFWRGEVTRVA
jgi:hypothetical protein